MRFSRVFNCEQLPQKTSVPCRFVDAKERLPDEADTYLVLYQNFSVYYVTCAQTQSPVSLA